ncbi:hypothetical protein ISN44_As03g035370 [Arabidopsis suecica]|uniref:Uncharacterized protein n=1 Tax=Arabidopsis suecica TaxID=45249 RepID=A0A8T2FAH4_ARASU|nr:hypothetical protein ISN44_As03g035370 [Arabidopsis suecica]
MVGSLSSSHEAVSHRKLQPGGGATLTYEDASRLDLVSRLLGSSPYFRSLRPTPLRCFPRLLLQKTRFCFISSLIPHCKLLCRSMEPIVHGRRLDPNHTLLQCGFKLCLITWPLESPRGFTFVFSNHVRGQMNLSRNNDIMIPAPRSGDYRNFLDLLSPYPLFTELIHVPSIIFSDTFNTLKTLKPMSFYHLSGLNRRQTLYGFLNLHGRELHVGENPPVLLRFITRHLRILVFASSNGLRCVFSCLKVPGLLLLNLTCGSFDSGFGSLPNDYLSSSSLEDFKPFTLYTTSIRYGLPKLQSHLTAALPLNLTHRSTVFARALVKALPRVVCLVPPSFTSLTLTPTPLRLLTMTNCSSFDLLLEDLSISFDLTCTNKLPSFWFKALKDLISINPIYPFMFLMLSYLMFSLGYALYCDVLNFGNSFPLHLCIWFPW